MVELQELQEEIRQESKASSSVDDGKKAKWKDGWKRGILKKLEGVASYRTNFKISIFRVPKKLRKVNDDAYSPSLVSIGPFHRDNPDLAAMREHKWRYMLNFLLRAENNEQPLYTRNLSDEEPLLRFENLIKAINGLDYEEIRRSYAEEIRYHDDDLAEMMLLDGCFIMELFLRYDQHLNATSGDSRFDLDPIFKNAWMMEALRRDLVLLENQIPLSILQNLYHISSTSREYLPTLAIKFLQPMNQPIGYYSFVEGGDHLLSLLNNFHSIPFSTTRYRATFRETNNRHQDPDIELTTVISIQPASNQKWGFNRCALELVDAGIKFQNGPPEDYLFNIIFSKGTIRIPEVFIDETKMSFLRNLIAFEQCHIDSEHFFTSYVILMKSLIRSSEDVKILRERGIIKHNWIEDQEYIAHFKSIVDEVVVRDFCFGELCDRVNAYGRKFSFGKYLKSLYQIYFSTAWSLISFIAALSLFILTITQTYYSIHPP